MRSSECASFFATQYDPDKSRPLYPSERRSVLFRGIYHQYWAQKVRLLPISSVLYTNHVLVLLVLASVILARP